MDWNELLLNLLCAIVTCIIPIIGNAIVKYVKTKTTNNTILLAVESVKTAVISTSQVFVDTLKKQGKFDSEAQKLAKDNAVKVATELITADTKKIIESAYGDFNVWLDTTIEQLVKETK